MKPTFSFKKKRKSGMKPRRNAYVPNIKEKDSSPDNMRQARFGGEHPDAIAIFQLVMQIQGEREPARAALERHLAALMHLAVSSGSGDVLQSLARLAKAPIAHPVYDRAMEWRDEALLHAEGHAVPRFTREDVIADIQKRTGCNSRTAEKAISMMGLSELFKWKAGRPKR